MTGATRSSHDRPVRSKQADSELKERIERLEERLEESILGDDGLAALDQGAVRQGAVRQGTVRHDTGSPDTDSQDTDRQGTDREPSDDTLKPAVGRSSERGSGKA